MYLMFIFLITTVIGLSDGAIKNISGEEISKVKHCEVNEYEEFSGSTSNGRKRSRGTLDLNAKVVALSPTQLQNSENFVCDICNLRFPRIRNLQYHLRTHNIYYELPEEYIAESAWKKVYICPDLNCIHHNPTQALSSIIAIKKHYKRKHGEKSLRCEKCLHKYALKSDLDAHVKKCSTKNYECGRYGSNYSRIDGFEVHKVECQLQGPVSHELVHISRTMSVNDLQVPKLSTESGPSSTPSINNIDQSLKQCEIFQTSKFIVPEPLQSSVQMSNSSQAHLSRIDSCREKSIWELTYWDQF